jgi:hypothetical protein
VSHLHRTVLAGSVLALFAAGILLPAVAEATLLPRTVFADEFGRLG